MKLLEDLAWPAELQAELEREIAAIPVKRMLVGADIPQICPKGFRKDPKNVPSYRERLRNALLQGDAAPDTLEFFRRHSFYQEFVCVLSEVALTVGFDAMAAFTGGAKLVLGMLLDLRKMVRDKALAFVASGAPFPPVPDDPDAARARLAETFEPFVKAFSSVAVAQNVTVVNREDDDKRLIATLQEELRNSREARTAAENAAREAAREVAAAERRVRTLERELEERVAAIAATDAALRAADAARTEAERLRDAAESDGARARLESADLIRFRDECFRLRSDKHELETQRAALVAHTEELEAEVARLRDEGQTRAEDALREHIAVAPEPVALPDTRTLRDRLAKAARCDNLPEQRRLHLLIDGHNVLNLVPEFVERIGQDSHEDLRRRLVDRLLSRIAGLGLAETDVYFDGEIRNDYNPARNVRVHFSGGEGDHKADLAVLDVLPFYVSLDDCCVVVTEDGDFRREAMSLGSHVIGSRDFWELVCG